MGQGETEVEVLVIGAGMAGLTVARALAVDGVNVLLLEAQERIGGRILTQRVGTKVVELGAEFVHGRPPELVALIEEAGLTLVERSGAMVHDRGGALVVDDGDAEGDEADDPFSRLEELENFSDSDRTFAEFLAPKNLAQDKKDEAIAFIEGFNAADHRVISTIALSLQQKAEDAIEGSRSFHVQGGYDQLPEFLARKLEEHGGEMRMDTRVDRLEWQPGRVVARTNQGNFAATKAVIAVPLGLLVNGSVRFEPALLERQSDIFLREGPIRVGEALRFTMIFRERFWENLPPHVSMSELSFLISRKSVPPVWWTTYPEISHSLTGWIGGPRTVKHTGLSAEALAGRGCESLAKIFHLDAGHVHSLLTGCFSHDWSADPNFRGAYSYIAKGGLAAPGILAEPIFDTLYFTGEHTATDGHWGTVHAALGSGLRAANQILAAGKDRAEIEKEVSG